MTQSSAQLNAKTCASVGILIVGQCIGIFNIT